MAEVVLINVIAILFTTHIRCLTCIRSLTRALLVLVLIIKHLILGVLSARIRYLLCQLRVVWVVELRVLVLSVHTCVRGAVHARLIIVCDELPIHRSGGQVITIVIILLLETLHVFSFLSQFGCCD